MLWHARRYEQALLSYRVQGTEILKTWTEINEQVEVQKPRPRFDRGPDFSGVGYFWLNEW